MEGVGIYEDFYVLMRPLDGRLPKRGESALIQFFDTDGDVYEATIKVWKGQGKYEDGKGSPFEGRKGMESKAVAVVRGIIGRL